MTLSPLWWGTVPVPFTALWTFERDNRRPEIRTMRIGREKLPMLCEGVDAPRGKPLFKMLHSDRTRRVVREVLCQMCVRPMPRQAVGFNQGGRLQGRPLLRDGLPMCPRCALSAFRACPGLVRQEAGGLLHIWLCQRGKWDVVPVVNGPTPVAKGGVAAVNELLLAHRGPVFSGPDLLLSSFRLLSLADLESMA